MTPERWATVQTLALAMAGEIEWVDFVGGGAWRSTLTRFAQDPDVHVAVRGVLARMFATLEPLVAGLPSHQEDELQAAGLVQAAFKSVAFEIFPEARPADGDDELITKFARLHQPAVQAPRGVWVPSLRDQLAGRRPFIPGGQP